MILEPISLRQNELLMLNSTVKHKRFFEVKKKIKKDSKSSISEMSLSRKALDFSDIQVEAKYRYIPVSTSSINKLSDKENHYQTVNSIKMR